MGRHRMDTEMVSRVLLSEQDTQALAFTTVTHDTLPVAIDPTMTQTLFSMDKESKGFIHRRGDDIIWCLIALVVIIGLGALWALNP